MTYNKSERMDKEIRRLETKKQILLERKKMFIVSDVMSKTKVGKIKFRKWKWYLNEQVDDYG